MSLGFKDFMFPSFKGGLGRIAQNIGVGRHQGNAPSSMRG